MVRDLRGARFDKLRIEALAGFVPRGDRGMLGRRTCGERRHDAASNQVDVRTCCLRFAAHAQSASTQYQFGWSRSRLRRIDAIAACHHAAPPESACHISTRAACLAAGGREVHRETRSVEDERYGEVFVAGEPRVGAIHPPTIRQSPPAMNTGTAHACAGSKGIGRGRRRRGRRACPASRGRNRRC